MPKDMNKLAAMVVALATGQAEPEPMEREKDPAAVALGRKGGLKGGKARKLKVPKEVRSELARKAVQSRWEKQKKAKI